MRSLCPRAKERALRWANQFQWGEQLALVLRQRQERRPFIEGASCVFAAAVVAHDAGNASQGEAHDAAQLDFRGGSAQSRLRSS